MRLPCQRRGRAHNAMPAAPVGCRRYRAFPESGRRECYDVHDVRILLLAVEDMLAAAQVCGMCLNTAWDPYSV